MKKYRVLVEIIDNQKYRTHHYIREEIIVEARSEKHLGELIKESFGDKLLCYDNLGEVKTKGGK